MQLFMTFYGLCMHVTSQLWLQLYMQLIYYFITTNVFTLAQGRAGAALFLCCKHVFADIYV